MNGIKLIKTSKYLVSEKDLLMLFKACHTYAKAKPPLISGINL